MAYHDPQNHCQFLGRLSKEVKVIKEGRGVFNLAIKSSYTDKDKEPYWPSFFVDGKSLDFMQKYTSTGDLILVTAKYVEWKDKEGKRTHAFDVVTVNKVGSKGENKPDNRDTRDTRDTREYKDPRESKREERRREEDNDYDIPF